MDTKAMKAPASTSHGVSWAGVFERVFVKTSMDGAVSKAPHQLTYVAAAGQGTATVNVPMSSSHLHRHSRGKKPKVANGVAQVQLKVKRSTVERLDDDYTRPLPVAVKVNYKLNGKPISGSDIKGKSGTVEVDYQLTNTTTKPVNVCFKGFNGKVVHKTVKEVAPIYAYMSLTLPKDVTKFTAPHAFENADFSGVNPQWLIGLFKPLGPTQQTLKLTMDTSKAKIPKATLLLEFVEPEALTASAPTKSALLVARSQAAAAVAARKVQADVAALELKAGQPHQPRSSSGRGGSRGAGSSRGGSRGGHSSRGGAPSLSFGTSTASLAQMQSQIGTLGHADRTFFNNVSLPTGELIGSTDRSSNTLAASTASSIDGLTASTSRSINSVTTSTSRSINGVTASTGRSIDGLASDLRRSLDGSSLTTITSRARRLERMTLAIGTLAGRLVPEVSALTRRVKDLVAALPTPVENALRLYSLFGVLNRDLDAFAPAVKTTAEFLKLRADITAGQTLAKTVSDSISQIHGQAQSVVGRVETLQTDVMSLQSKLGTLLTATVTNAENTTQRRFEDSLQGLHARFAADIATAEQSITGVSKTADSVARVGKAAQKHLADAQASAHQRVAAAKASAHQTVTSATDHAKHAVAQALGSARQKVAAAVLKVKQTLASVHAKARAALAAAKAKAKQGGQAALAAAQASAAKAVADAQKALTTANNDYADLLGINQQAVAWELPAGDATDVTEQEGSLIYTITGT